MHPDFTAELKKQWENKNFTYQQCKEWINVGLKPQDSRYAAWLRDEIKISPTEFSDDDLFREQYQEYLKNQTPASDNESEDEQLSLAKAFALSLGIFDFGDLFSLKKRKISDQELEKYLLEKRLELKKHFPFNIQELTTEKARDDFGNVSRNGRVITASLSKDLTTLALANGWDDNISKDGKELKKNILILNKENGTASSHWECNDLDKQIRDKKELYIILIKDNNWVDWKGRVNNVIDQSSMVKARVKPSLYLLSKKKALEFLREENKFEREKDQLKVLVKLKTDIPGEIEEVVRFETWWNKNLATVINDDGNHWVFLLVYEQGKNSENPYVFPVDYSYQGDYGIYVKKREKHSCLSDAQKEAEWLRKMLDGKNPILVVHHLANDYDSFYWVINNPYVEKYEVGHHENNTFYWPSDLDSHIKPLSVIRVEKQNTAWGKKYYHVGVYIGDNKVFHIYDYWKTRDMKARIDDIRTFLGDAKGTQRVGYHIEVFQPIIPFREWKKVIRSIVWAKEIKFWNGRYCLANRNCEHLANMMVYGINYSKQVAESPAGSRVGCKMSGSACLKTGCGNFKSNNGKKSICLRNEIDEVNNKFYEAKENNKEVRQLEARIVVPNKIPNEKCGIM
ncbi:Tankyrase-2 [endosymbiont GvMRE of Glomus versiforme]|nr:Tankyrase-2 [endosymbiont GvMRE of Glomus versiforme]